MPLKTTTSGANRVMKKEIRKAPQQQGGRTNIIVVVLLLLTAALQAQPPRTLTLEQAFATAEQQFPLTRQKGLLQQTQSLSLQNLSSNFLPQLTLSGQASYQSEVTKVTLPLPGLKIPEQSKDQYRVLADVSQLLYDGGATRSQKTVQQLTTAVEEQRVAVELHHLKARINGLYFGILHHDELLKQTGIAARDVQAGIDKVKPQVENKVVLRSNLLLLQAQLLQVEQRAIEINASRKGLVEALAQFLNTPLTDGIQLQPPATLPATDTVLARAEVVLYQRQADLLKGQEKFITVRNLPKASAFLQAGYGRPGLNLLSNQFEPFYISGLRFTWPLGGLYNAGRDKKLLDLGRQTIDLQQQTFLQATRAQLQQQRAEIDKYAALLASDEAIIQLRKQITETARAQLENAVITASDYILQANAEDAARQQQILHKMQWLQAQTTYLITSGKL